LTFNVNRILVLSQRELRHRQANRPDRPVRTCKQRRCRSPSLRRTSDAGLGRFCGV